MSIEILEKKPHGNLLKRILEEISRGVSERNLRRSSYRFFGGVSEETHKSHKEFLESSEKFLENPWKIWWGRISFVCF